MKKWWPLVAVCLGSFMLLIDVTIVNVALPRMATDLQSSFGSLQWVLDGYALSLGVLLLGAGALADRMGHRRLYVVGLVIFAVSSLACGVAASAGLVIAARVVQGIGAAAMLTTTFALLNASYQGRERGVAYGIWGGVSSAASAIGPVLGGVLTDGLGWRWIFLVNLPISIVTLVLCALALRPDGARRRGRFDFVGTAAFTVSAATVTYAVIRVNEVGWSSPRTWGLLLVSAAALVTFVLVERRRPDPMLDLKLLRIRSFTGILIASLLVNFSAFAILAFTSIWLQSLIGLSALEAGLTAVPMGVLALIVATVAGSRLQGRSPRVVISTGMALIGVGGLLGWALVGPGSSWPALIAGYSVIGIGVGLAMPVMASSAMAVVPARQGGMAAGALNTAPQLGFAIGVAVLGTVFAARAADRLGDAEAAHGLAAGQAQRIIADHPSLTSALHEAAAAGLDLGFVVAGVAGLLGALAVVLLVRRSPSGASPSGTSEQVETIRSKDLLPS